MTLELNCLFFCEDTPQKTDFTEPVTVILFVPIQGNAVQSVTSFQEHLSTNFSTNALSIY